MKELYMAPEAEIVRFAAEEALANDLATVSFVGIDVTNSQDGDWESWSKWFS